jgi:hypothetical protein
MRYALVLGSMGKHEGREATVSAAPEERGLTHAMGAAAGVKTRVVDVGQPSNYEVVSDERPKSGALPATLVMDEAVLRQLHPGAEIVVGSLRHNMPAVQWLTDPGGMVVEVPSPKKIVSPVPAARYRTVRGAPARPGGPIVVKVQSLPKQPLGVRGPVMKVALDGASVRGVPLKDGDVVVDESARKWFFRGGALWSHKSVTLPRSAVVLEGRVLRPARAGTPLVGPSRGEKVEVLLLGDNEATVYGVVTDDDEHLWSITMEVARSIVSDPRATCFGARLAATAAECYAAGGVWDRPCDRDTECPYFDPRTGRGKCVSGMCEMPLKVGNRSFRTADASPVMYENVDSPYEAEPGAMPLFGPLLL